MDPLDRAVQILGGQLALAEAMRKNLRQSHVSMWKHRGRVPAEYCPDIEWATKGVVTCEQLRPDVRWSVLRRRK